MKIAVVGALILAFAGPVAAQSAIDPALVEAANALNRGLPAVVDQYTEWLNVQAMPMRTLLYRYRLTQFEITADNQQQAQLLLDGEIKQEGTTTVCTTPESSRLLQSGVTMRYDYYDMSMAYVGTFSVKWSDCQQRR